MNAIGIVEITKNKGDIVKKSKQIDFVRESIATGRNEIEEATSIIFQPFNLNVDKK